MSAHATVHLKIGSRTGIGLAWFKDAFVNLQAILVLAGELAHQKESGSLLRPRTNPLLIA